MAQAVPAKASFFTAPTGQAKYFIPEVTTSETGFMIRDPTGLGHVGVDKGQVNVGISWTALIIVLVLLFLIFSSCLSSIYFMRNSLCKRVMSTEKFTDVNSEQRKYIRRY